MLELLPCHYETQPLADSLFPSLMCKLALCTMSKNYSPCPTFKRPVTLREKFLSCFAPKVVMDSCASRISKSWKYVWERQRSRHFWQTVLKNKARLELPWDGNAFTSLPIKQQTEARWRGRNIRTTTLGDLLLTSLKPQHPPQIHTPDSLTCFCLLLNPLLPSPVKLSYLRCFLLIL